MQEVQILQEEVRLIHMKKEQVAQLMEEQRDDPINDFEPGDNGDDDGKERALLRRIEVLLVTGDKHSKADGAGTGIKVECWIETRAGRRSFFFTGQKYRIEYRWKPEISKLFRVSSIKPPMSSTVNTDKL